jgi:nitroreductase
MRNVLAALAVGLGIADAAPAGGPEASAVTLPRPRTEGDTAVERALASRRSVREFSGAPLELEAVSQLLWSAQGITGPGGLRTAPSAGALYPLEIYLIAGAVSDLAAGTYHYDPRRHRIALTAPGDVREQAMRAALEQSWVAEAPAILVLAAVHERTERKYEPAWSGRFATQS